MTFAGAVLIQQTDPIHTAVLASRASSLRNRGGFFRKYAAENFEYLPFGRRPIEETYPVF